MKATPAVFFATCLAAVAASASVVRIEGSKGSWRMTRNGEEYFIRGAGGVRDLEKFAAAGGNSVRTWGADDAAKELDRAEKCGVTVMVGFWLGHAEHGFDYTNTKALDSTLKSILRTVAELKDHDALLCWALGNEMELNNPHQEELWRFIDRAAAEVKKIDPNHPVCTVVAEVWPEKAAMITRLCPNLYFLGINSYGGAHSIGERWSKMGAIPYVLTEYGLFGVNETGRTGFGAPFEPTSTDKAGWIGKIYDTSIAPLRGKWCLGGYAFIWGTKVEGTPTWHGLLLPSGDMLAGAQIVQDKWGVAKSANRVPEIKPLNADRLEVASTNDLVTVETSATDPDGDPLVWRWALIDENGYYGDTGLGGAAPKGHKGVVVEGRGTPKVKVSLPKPGIYRLYAYVFDGKGGAAFANVPLQYK